MMGFAFTDWDEVPLIMDPVMVSRLIGRTVESVTRMCRNGEIPAVKLGREWRIERDKLMEKLGVGG